MNVTETDASRHNPSPNMSLKIYFCDGCNESIPLKDINANRITIDAGKIFCAKCAPRKPRETSRFPAAVVAALLVLVAVLVGTAAFLMGRQLQSLQQDLSRVGHDVVRLEANAQALRREALLRDDAATQRAEVVESIGRVEKELAAATERANILSATLRTEISAVEQRMIEAAKADRANQAREVEALKQQVSTANESIVTLRASLDAADHRVTDLAAKVAELAAAPRVVAPVPESSPAGGAGPAGAAGASAAADKEVHDLLGKLKDREAAERYKAVIELGRLKGEAVIASLEAAMTDPESYVRDAVVRQLRKLGSPTSIPVVLKGLRDEDYFVRASARDALKALTGADVAYDPGASPAEREARAKEWDAWWAANREKLLKK